MYTTNAIENFNRQLRKVTKNKSIFPTELFLRKKPLFSHGKCYLKVDVKDEGMGPDTSST